MAMVIPHNYKHALDGTAKSNRVTHNTCGQEPQDNRHRKGDDITHDLGEVEQ